MERQYIICLRDGKRLKFKGFRYFKDAVLTYPDEEIQYLAIRDGEEVEQMKALSVFNIRLNELIRPKQDALDQLLTNSLKGLKSREEVNV